MSERLTTEQDCLNYLSEIISEKEIECLWHTKSKLFNNTTLNDFKCQLYCNGIDDPWAEIMGILKRMFG